MESPKGELCLMSKLDFLRSLPGILPQGKLDRKVFPAPGLLECGIPRGAITEISGREGGGKTEFLMDFLKANANLRVAWVESRMTVYPFALAAHGISLRRILFVEPPVTNLVWTLHQLLKSGLFEVVVLSHAVLPDVDLRKLQIFSEQAQAAMVMLADEPRREGSWPLALQLEVRRKTGGSCDLEIEVLKAPNRRGVKNEARTRFI